MEALNKNKTKQKTKDLLLSFFNPLHHYFLVLIFDVFIFAFLYNLALKNSPHVFNTPRCEEK